MAKAPRANSPISTAVAAVLSAPGATAADTPVAAPVVAEADLPSTPVLTTADAEVAAPVFAEADLPSTPVLTTADAEVAAPVTTAADTGPAPVVPVKARVLAYCGYGKPDDVVEIDPTLLEVLKDVVDASPAAVAYAESLSN